MNENAMSRDEITRPGSYVSIPKDWLATRDLTPGEKLVLMVYIEALGPKNRAAWPGHDSIAERTGLSGRGVQNSVKSLVAKGWLTSRGFSSDATVVYQLNRVRTPATSALSALPVEKEGSALSALVGNGVRLDERTECASRSALSAPKVPKSTEPVTEEVYRSDSGLSPAAASPLTSPASPSPLPLGYASNCSAVGRATNTVVTTASPVPTATPWHDDPFDQDVEGPAVPSGWADDDEVGYAGDGPLDDEGIDEEPLSAIGEFPRLAATDVPATELAIPAVREVQTAGIPVAAEDGREQRAGHATAAAADDGADDRLKIAASSLDELEKYLLTNRFSERRRPNRDWRRHAEGTDAGLAKWSIEDFAANFWFRLNGYRAARGRPLLPPTRSLWGRSCRDIKTMIGHRTLEDTLLFIEIATTGFDYVRERIGGSMGDRLTLDEGVLSHGQIGMAVGCLMDDVKTARRDAA